jgi:MFS family permease
MTVARPVRGGSPPSYAELWRIPGMRPLAVSVGLSRWVLDGMLPILAVLTCLRLFGSPAIAGLVVFLGTVPGLVLTPFAGALLDRRGRIAFIRIDVFVAMVVFAALAALIVADRLTVPMIAIAAVVLSCTRPLAQAGARAQVPTITPERLWDRVNAVDTAMFTAVSLTAPAAASALFGLLGPAPVFMVGAALLLVTAAVLTRVPETVVASDPGSVWEETRTGTRYFFRNRTLISLALSSSLLNFAPGTIIVVLPIIIVNHMQQSAAVVGLLLAIEQVGAAVALIVAGRLGTRGREVPLMAAGAVATAVGVLLILVAPGIPLIAVGMLIVGAGGGPYWVAVYGLRQRRTVPHMFARAFALSYAGNVAGQPLSSAIAGSLSSAGGVVPALALAVAGPLLGIAALLRIPRDPATE